MKIISKFKDYYDYIAGLYGIDVFITYPRYYQEIINSDFKKGDYQKKEWKNVSLPVNVDRIGNFYPEIKIFAICNIIYVIGFYKNQIYIGQDLLQFLDLYKYSNGKNKLKKIVEFHLTVTNVNTKESPIVKLNYNLEILSKNPRLLDYSFEKVVSANDMFLKLTTFLSQEFKFTDTRTNLQKVESNGFDKITSFRNM